MKRMAAAFAIAAVAALTTGCYKVTIVNNGAIGGGASPAYTDRWNHNAVVGLANLSGPQDASSACPNGWATIETQQTFVQGLVGSIVQNLYTPQNLTIRCK
jgi:hypothetical protein